MVIPCFNSGPFLREAIDSLDGQLPHELAIVNDGSTNDETLRILGELENDGLTVIDQENAGPGAARMTGVRHTSAPLLFFLDADDRLLPGALRALAHAIEAHDCAVAWGDLLEFGAHDAYGARGRDLDLWLLTYLNWVPAALMVRREALLAVGGWPTEAGYEDWSLALALAEHGYSGRNVGRPVIEYRVHGSNGALASHRREHSANISVLKHRHRNAFSTRRRTRTRSTAPRALRILLPVVDFLPLVSDETRYRLNGIAVNWLDRRHRWTRTDELTVHPAVGALLRRLRPSQTS